MVEERVTVALAQSLPGAEPADILAAAKGVGAEIVVFPEMYSNGLASFDPAQPGARERWSKDAHAVDGEFVGRFRRAAREQGIHVVATLLEAAEPRPFNTALLIDPDGRTVLHHNKIHICDFCVPECAIRRERPRRHRAA